MKTIVAVQNAAFASTFATICKAILTEQERPEDQTKSDVQKEQFKPLFVAFTEIAQSWERGLKPHQMHSFRKHRQKLENYLLQCCHDKQAANGKGGTTFTKIMGVLKGVLENVELMEFEGTALFERAVIQMETLAYKAFPEEYDAQFDSGSIAKSVEKVIAQLNEWGYFLKEEKAA